MIGRLSGGERARLALAKLVLAKPSWLALDEPTNHLDLAGRTALEEMLSEFPGTLVFVSHDREFIDTLATRVVEVKDGAVRSFPGNYTDYRKALGGELENERAEREAEGAPGRGRARTRRQVGAAQEGEGPQPVAPGEGRGSDHRAREGEGRAHDLARRRSRLQERRQAARRPAPPGRDRARPRGEERAVGGDDLRPTGGSWVAREPRWKRTPG